MSHGLHSATMRSYIRCSILLCGGAVLSGCHFGKRTIPPEFEYQQGWVTEDADQVDSRSLPGIVVDPSGEPMQSVLVEQMTSDWKQRINTRLTDEHGKFHFYGIKKGIVYIRVRYPAFNDQRIPVHVTGTGPDLRIDLQVSN